MMQVTTSSVIGTKRDPDVAAPIFGEVPQVLKTVSTLVRLTMLDKRLPQAGEEEEAERLETREALEAIWNSGLKKLASTQGAEKEELQPGSSSLEKTKESLVAKLTKLDLSMCTNIRQIYEAEIIAATKREDLEKCMHRFWKDTKSVPISPLNRSHRGVNGPTLLISYPRLSPDLKQMHLQNYVAKWTNWNELCSTRIYAEFSAYLAEPSNNAPFLVPEIAAIDPRHNIHEMTDGSHTVLPEDVSKLLDEKCMEVVRIAAPGVTPKNEQIMLQERVAGSNLFDFAKTKYEPLSQERKQELFKELGKLAMLDVLMGNLDRFIRVEDNDSPAYELSTYESNLGNVMIKWIEGQMDSPCIYAIDNGINEELISDPLKKEKYNTFLEEQFADPQMADRWAQTMIKSIRSCVRNDGLEENTFKECKPFLADLETIAIPAISQGIAEAFIDLKRAIELHWDGDSSPLKNHLSWAHPELLAAVSERFEILKSSRM